MKKILYYSDCPFFAGCENMLVNFFGSEQLASEFELVFVYRYSKRYEEGACKRMDMSRSIPAHLVTEPEKESIITSDNHYIAVLQKCIWAIRFIVTKYYSIQVNYRRLAQIFSKEAPDIIHINNGGYPAATSCYSAVLAAKRCGISNVVYMVNNMAMDYKHPFRWLDRGLDSIVKEHVSYFINGSNNAGSRLKEVLALPDAKQLTIRNGIIPRNISMSKKEFREKFGIGDDTFVFAEVANLEERKGHIVLLRAVQKFLEYNSDRDFVVLIEGNGPLKDSIASFITDNNLSKYVCMMEVDHIYDLYNAIDVLILPSLHTEDFPNTIIEAMGQGIPVIGTNIAGIPEQIDDHRTGLLIPPADEVALATAMMELSSNKELYSLCKKEAKSKFEKNYTAQISVNNYIELYHSMLYI